MKPTLLAFLLAISPCMAADETLTPAVKHTELSNALSDPFEINPSSEQYDAFLYFVRMGPSGWDFLIDAQFATNKFGDTVRRIDSLWETGSIPRDLVEGYQRARRAELLKRAANETWAILYAGAYERSADLGNLFVPLEERLSEKFASVRQHLDQPNEALIDVAFLRVLLDDQPSFPGHHFPWTAPAAQRKQALRELLDWWQQHRPEFEGQELE